MTPYQYRCGGCGPFVASHPMGGAPARETCPGCAALSPRSFAAPATRRTDARLAAAVGAAEASAERPQVVAAPASPGGQARAAAGPRSGRGRRSPRPALPRY